ncbi:MAG TPA: phospholipase D-like domain-containing protein [Candidatus Wunengus sp. YC60]|uniref:phospholipase D-like domain-containing protein n=1 Tax=Candidatus Wunengus sp. YC60 TaxID=3367697 RepID=UPI004024E8C5
MSWKSVYISVILGIAGVFLFVQERAFSSEVYFTPTEIKGQIIRVIEECKESVDIAVLDITSHEILNALIKAQERGVRIRIVVDRKRALRKGLLSNQYKNKEFAIKVLVQKGIMHNNFAVFDCKLLTTGSYYWNENVGKFSRDNAIFTDETKLLVKYQKEFDRLFHEGIAPDIKESVPVSAEKVGKIDEKPTADISKDIATGGRTIVSNYGVVITETSDGYINMDFEEFNNIFGVASDLTDEQKEAMWSRCVGKRVKWRGKVNYIGWGLVTGWMLGVTHGDTGVEIKLNSGNKSHFSDVKYGNTVTYTGKLDSRVTRIFPYKLEDGDILKHENTSPEPSNAGELAVNPYTMPVSQGPKKISLVETFEDLDNIFGKGSNLSDAQKDEAWGKYKGKYVSWMGQIVYKNLNVASGLRIGMMQKEKGDVEVKFGRAKKEKVLKFQEGETVRYTGRLTERCGSHSPYILEDGDIITIK